MYRFIALRQNFSDREIWLAFLARCYPFCLMQFFLRNIMLRCENASVLYEADLLRKTITHVLYKTRKGLDKNDSGTAKGAPSEYPTVIP